MRAEALVATRIDRDWYAEVEEVDWVVDGHGTLEVGMNLVQKGQQTPRSLSKLFLMGRIDVGTANGTSRPSGVAGQARQT